MNFFERVWRFIRSVWLELRRVVWPDRKQTVVYTLVVVASVAIVSLLLWATDSVLGGLMELIVR